MLAIACRRDPIDWLDAWESHIGELPTKMGVIRIGAMSPSAGIDRSVRETIDLPLAAVDRPSDLNELYAAISLYVSEWLHTDQRTVIWLESLTPMLDHVGTESTLEFLEALTDRLRATGAIAYVQLDRRAHDDRTVAKVRSAFDTVIETGDRTAEPPSPDPVDHPRRRAVLRTLQGEEGPLSLSAIAGRVAARENARHPEGVDPANARLIGIDLHHAQLPKLANAGLIDADPERRAVDLAVPHERVDAVLARTDTDT